MRVTTNTIEEFLECLEGITDLHDNTVRVSILRQPISGNKKTALSFEVEIHCSTVVNEDTGSQYILETVSIFCGVDFNDGGAEQEGTVEAARFKEQIKNHAGTKGWRVLPGMISE